MKAIAIPTKTQQPVYIELSEDTPPVLITVDEDLAGGGTASVEDKAAALITHLDQLGDTIVNVCLSLHGRIEGAWDTAKPRELTLEFGVKLAGELGVPLIAKGSAEGTFIVTAKWTFPEPVTK
jgi:Trypsin-co-occurring domain 1